MQRIFIYGDIQNTNLTPDEVLSTVIYWKPFYIIIYRSRALLKMVHFFVLPCIS